MRRWLRSLHARVTLVMAAVAAVATLVAGLVGAQLIRSAAVDQARAGLAREATALSASGSVTDLTSLRELAFGEAGRIALVAPDGTVTGAGRRLVSAGAVKKVLAGQPVSQTEIVLGIPVVVEARPLAAGGGLVLAEPVSAVAQAAGPLVARLLWALLIGFAAAVLGGAVVARWVARPLVRLAGAARRLAAGERGVAVDGAGPAEVADVSHALAGLDASLTASESRQREFLLSVSHEVRTPLTALQGYAEALADGVIPAEDVTRVGRTLSSETERLDHFVRDLLELARLEADDFRIDSAPFDAADLLHAMVDAWRGVWEPAGVAMRAEVPGPLPVVTDARRLRQLLDGLVENALRAVPRGAPVVLSGRRGDDAIVLEVRDGGPGLTDDDLDHAFERGALQRRYAGERKVGTGLGLSIAARLAGRLGAALSAGRAPEGGALFSLRVPPA
ncbi:two-component sensor histidine kinase [Sinomonas cellulolyticus]|uniref:histidine kinase n=1 Tax=Sinomonas cellulolyticus TaxID=2801916 RepID=A0ABS1K2T5_9MICC|nr:MULTISPECIES: HAMP domain-containing sensor histidine kinase [Sinomonas]MBL0705975.1 HAMP domain-containing histidine kinase [Sinomonas cellulolyticus]GHG42888.1 two-component sensor histidine kinase [Sinomonas sp. KCTC 49339]